MKKIIIAGISLLVLMSSCASNRCSSIGCGYSEIRVELPEKSYNKGHDISKGNDLLRRNQMNDRIVRLSYCSDNS